MENLIIEATKYTPGIFFDCRRNILEIRGKSYPENAGEFYSPVFSWLDEYLENSGDQETTVNIEFVYFNSSSSKVLLDLFDKLDEAAGNGKSVTVNWIYAEDDEDALEFGEDFQEDVKYIRFNLVQKKE